MPANQQELAQARAASAASLAEFVRGFQARQFRNLAIEVTPALIMASMRHIKGRR
jgi:hypothetical protein